MVCNTTQKSEKKKNVKFGDVTLIVIQWVEVDSSKRWNDAENLTLLNNVETFIK